MQDNEADEITRSSDADEQGGASVPDHSDKQSNTGCLILVLLAMPAIDAIGVVMPQAGRYSQTVAPCLVSVASFAGPYWGRMCPSESSENIGGPAVDGRFMDSLEHV